MFDGVLTTDTYVLGWHREGERLVFAVEASLWPGHPAYELPRFDQWTCSKPGRLVFEGVQAVDSLPEMTDVPYHTDPDGSRDFGSLSDLAAVPGGYRISGDFGAVVVTATSIRLEVCEPGAAP